MIGNHAADCAMWPKITRVSVLLRVGASSDDAVYGTPKETMPAALPWVIWGLRCTTELSLAVPFQSVSHNTPPMLDKCSTILNG